MPNMFEFLPIRSSSIERKGGKSIWTKGHEPLIRGFWLQKLEGFGQRLMHVVTNGNCKSFYPNIHV